MKKDEEADAGKDVTSTVRGAAEPAGTSTVRRAVSRARTSDAGRSVSDATATRETIRDELILVLNAA